MKAADLQKKTVIELQKLGIEERAKLQQLKFDLPGGKIKNVRQIRQIRRNIARVLTVMRMKNTK